MSPQDEPDVMEDETERSVPRADKGVWLAKKGEGLGAFTGEKRRYFVPVLGVDTKMLKFVYFEDVQHGRPVGRKGFVPIDRQTRISASGASLIIVSAS
jgi:hypothetical protein